MRISKKLLFALEAVLDIAYHSGGEPVQSSAITRRQKIPKRYLEQVLQQLVRAGVLIGVRGPRGGYRLARERRRITLGEVARTVRELETTKDPLENPAGAELGRRILRPLWMRIFDETMARLDSLTVEDLCNQAAALGVASEAEEKLDFSI